MAAGTVFDDSDYQALVERVQKLRPDARQEWGKMSPAQMLAHCSEAMEVALGDKVIKRLFIGRIIGPFAKKGYVSEQPFKRDSPTAGEFIIREPRDFEKEKQRFLALLQRLHDGGPGNVTKHPHGFFGVLTPGQWGLTQWKHLDHHLRQFGV